MVISLPNTISLKLIGSVAIIFGFNLQNLRLVNNFKQFQNILSIDVTFCTFHRLKSDSKYLHSLNMWLIVVTFRTFHLLKSDLRYIHPLNIWFIVLTFPTSHFDKSRSFFPNSGMILGNSEKRFDMSVTE